MKSFILALCGLLGIMAHSQAGILYNYQWSTASNPVTVNSDNGFYQLQVTPGAAKSNQSVSQNVIAASLGFTVLGQDSPTDTFTNKSFTLNLSLDDVNGGVSTPAPLAFKVDFTMNVSQGGIAAVDIVNFTPATKSTTVGGLDFVLDSLSWKDAVNTDNGQIPGTIAMAIHVQENGNPPPTDSPGPHETPEPSSLVLAALGIYGAAFWRRHRRVRADS
jgi:hypothetical protein